MLFMVSEPSLTDPPIRTQVPSALFDHALQGIWLMSAGQLSMTQTCSSAWTEAIAARNATAVRNPSLDMFAWASR
jgi:hypothetical protein